MRSLHPSPGSAFEARPKRGEHLRATERSFMTEYPGLHSLRLDAGLAHHAAPFGDLIVNVAAESCRRACFGVDALLRQRLLALGCIEHRGDLAVETRDDRRRRCCGSDDSD